MKARYALVAACVFLLDRNADARTIDRVAALVGGQIIMLSEVREYAIPFLRMVHETETIARARAESRVLHDICERLVDEMLVAREAERMHLTVAPDEIQRAIAAVAANNQLTVPALIDAAREQGYTEAMYRETLRAQILEGKLLQLRNAGAAQTQKPEDMVKTLHTQLRGTTYIEVRLAQ